MYDLETIKEEAYKNERTKIIFDVLETYMIGSNNKEEQENKE